VLDHDKVVLVHVRVHSHRLDVLAVLVTVVLGVRSLLIVVDTAGTPFPRSISKELAYLKKNLKQYIHEFKSLISL